VTGGLWTLAAGIAAADDSDAVLLKASVADFAAPEIVDAEVDYLVTEVMGDDVFSTTVNSARIRVMANVPYAVVVTFPTWQPDPPAAQNFLQPAFSNGSHRIGGRLYLDPTPDAPTNGDTVFQTASGDLQAAAGPGIRLWGLGANISARFTDNPSGLAAPGTYSLDAQITIQPQ
jgi:hypothetical protein